MPYAINQTNGTLILTLLDGTADGPDVNPGLNSTDVNLIGKNYPNYGEIQNENFIKLLQNFAGNLPPTKPLVGELWYDTGTGFIRVYTGSQWLSVSPLSVANVAPTTSTIGAEWYDTTNKQLKLWNGSVWQVIGPGYSAVNGISGAIVENILDTLNNSHTVVKMYVNNSVVSIVSNDNTFTPQIPITGFTTISPGITLSTANSQIFYGTASNSQQLGGISSSNFARTDITTTFNANVNVGAGQLTLKSDVSSGAVSLTNTRIDGNFDLYNNVGGTNTKTLSIDGTTGLVLVAADPTSALGVATKGYVDSLVSSTASRYAPINSPSLSGTPTTTTPSSADNSTRIASTAFTQAAIASSTSALWQGSAKFVSTSTPTGLDGTVGDFWFQI